MLQARRAGSVRRAEPLPPPLPCSQPPGGAGQAGWAAAAAKWIEPGPAPESESSAAPPRRAGQPVPSEIPPGPAGPGRAGPGCRWRHRPMPPGRPRGTYPSGEGYALTRAPRAVGGMRTVYSPQYAFIRQSTRLFATVRIPAFFKRPWASLRLSLSPLCTFLQGRRSGSSRSRRPNPSPSRPRPAARARRSRRKREIERGREAPCAVGGMNTRPVFSKRPGSHFLSLSLSLITVFCKL